MLKETYSVVKVDCEGCEKHLLSLPDDLIRRVSKWVIECHGPEVLMQLFEKFHRAGFKVTFKPYAWRVDYHILGRDAVFNPHTKVPQTILLILTAHLP